ncbi:MAG: hypothetical protein QF918_08505 [Pirellulaceae bacterium]|jgi:hypothetical protein|nr:hypothetical protein [Pirellulaceae bacterium]MDP6721335.1 hypothetical protein [Pirellulaceae bacterium]
MIFTVSQLERIAAWKPADERLACDDPIERHIQPAVSALTSRRWQCHVVDDGRLSTYYSIAIHPSPKSPPELLSPPFTPYKGDALLIYLCLKFPVGVIGPTSIVDEPNFFTARPLDLNSIITPVKHVSAAVDDVLDVFDESIYRFLNDVELSQRLPPHVAPNEYCLCDEPWDRVFHVLFANTD